MSVLRRHLLLVSVVSLGGLLLAAGVAFGLSSSRAVHSDRRTAGTSTVGLLRCPSQDPRVIRSSRSGVNVTLVPAGVAQVLLCRYDGPFGAPRAHIANRFRLVARRLIVERARAGGLAAELDRIPQGQSGGYVCPSDTGAAIVAYFRYGSGPPDPVRVELSGCLTATNGHVTRQAGIGNATVLDNLEALIHATPPRSGRHGTAGARDATIHGHLLLCGGPAPGRCFVTTIGGCAPPEGCSRSDRVVAIGSAGAIVAQQRLRFPWPNGRFRVRVPPGQYAVELLADGARIHDRMMQTKGATAHAGHTATVVFQFNVS
jgi:hypothetical protein